MVNAYGAFLIDKHEVTNADYDAFLVAKKGAVDGQHMYCGFNTDFSRATTCPHSTGDAVPVNCIDWCDAWAYCKWAGKKLCGSIVPDAGDAVPSAQFASPGQSRWSLACGGPSQSTYPYGNDASTTACVVAESDASAPRPVASATGCVGAVPGLFDMAGNVREWEDSCDLAGADHQNSCHARGGGFDSPAVSARCGNVDVYPRDHTASNVGFRCCANLP
jgi:formylglycine-generating enzyme required for sulfatase activity